MYLEYRDLIIFAWIDDLNKDDCATKFSFSILDENNGMICICAYMFDRYLDKIYNEFKKLGINVTKMPYVNNKSVDAVYISTSEYDKLLLMLKLSDNRLKV